MKWTYWRGVLILRGSKKYSHCLDETIPSLPVIPWPCQTILKSISRSSSTQQCRSTFIDDSCWLPTHNTVDKITKVCNNMGVTKISNRCMLGGHNYLRKGGGDLGNMIVWFLSLHLLDAPDFLNHPVWAPAISFNPHQTYHPPNIAINMRAGFIDLHHNNQITKC